MEENRKEYAFILCVNNKITKVISKHWWSTEENMQQTAADMGLASRAFKKTASILVYEKASLSPIGWKIASSFNASGNLYIPKIISIWGDNRIEY